MKGSISGPFILHPIATSLLMIGILFVGIVAYPRLPVAPLPQVDFPTIQVSAQLSGASPDTMASAVAQPLETQFAQIPGIAQMTSISTLGSTAITIQFDLDRDIDGAANDVQAAINAAGGQLPHSGLGSGGGEVSSHRTCAALLAAAADSRCPAGSARYRTPVRALHRARPHTRHLCAALPF